MKLIRPVIILDAMLTATNVAETSPAADEWDPATAYSVGNIVTVTTVADGAAVATHDIYTCNTAHTNKDPTLIANIGTGNGWDKTDSTNRWRQFNGVLQQATTNANTITASLLPGAITNNCAFFGVDAASIRVVMNDPTDGDVYDTTFPMISDSGINNWYLYFTEEIVRKERLLVTDLPAFPAATLSYTVADTGANAELGEFVMGASFVIGDSQYGASFGIVDYSVKNTDSLGNTTVIQGAFSDTADINVIVSTGRFDQIQKVLKQYRSTPLVWITEDSISEAAVYGYYRNFRNTISGPVVSTTLLQLEGLT